MAFAVVQSNQSSGGSNSSTLTISAATTGNLLCGFFSQSGSTVQPTCSGFTVVSTKALYNSSLDSTWFAYKISTGGETSIAWTPGSGGTGRGVCGWELSGAPASVSFDVSAVSTDNTGSVNTITSPTITTGTAGSIVLLGVGASAGSGVISAWSGTNVATNIGTSTARCFGGSFITTSTISSTFTANWNTAHVACLLAVAILPPAVGNVSLSVPAASATGSAPTPGVAVSPAVAAAAATGSATVPGLALRIAPAAATATGSAPTPGVSLRLAPSAAAATASAPVPGVSLRIAPAAASATASAPTPGVSLRLAVSSAVATGSAPSPGVTIVTPSTGGGHPMRSLMGVGQ